MTINGQTIKAKLFAFDGCHKIYLLDDKAAADNARASEYGIYRIEELPDIFEHSCQLRFISNWNLDLPDYVRQFEDAVFDGFAMERSSKLCMDVLEEYLP